MLTLPRHYRSVPLLAVVALVLLVVASPGLAQTVPALTAEDYARAERWMGYRTAPLVFRLAVRANWLPDDRFWYRTTTPEGSEFVLVNPAQATRSAAFNHTGVAAALTAASGETVTATDSAVHRLRVHGRRGSDHVPGARQALALRRAGEGMHRGRPHGRARSGNARRYRRLRRAFA